MILSDMARLPRFDLAGVPQHVVQRGNNRLPCFLDDEVRQRYLQCLEKRKPQGQSALFRSRAFHAVARRNRGKIRLSTGLVELKCTLTSAFDPGFPSRLDG